MGTLTFPPIAELVKSLRDAFKLTTLVETGTYQGMSTGWAAKHFNQVVTLDIREDYQKVGIENCKDFDNITYLLGDSRAVLPAIVEALTEPALFWIDAHAVRDMFGPKDDCPLLEELEILNRSPHKHFILIDDAHCYKPPVPHDAAVWPEISEIEEKAHERGYLMWEAHDVIVLAPASAKDVVGKFVGTEAPPANTASAVIDIKSLRRRMHKNLFPTRFSCKATAIQGDIRPAARVKEHAQSVSEIVETDYGFMIIPKNDTGQTPHLEMGRSLDQKKIDKLVELIQQKPPGAVFLDVGANVGAFSFALQPYCESIFAWEPQRLIYNMFVGSVALNNWENIYCFNQAVAEGYGKIRVPQYDLSQRCSFGSIEIGGEQKEVLEQDEPKKFEYVDMIPIDDHIFQRVDLIKIDVEGFEEKVLKGARQTIITHRPILFVEHLKSDKKKLADQLLDMGYDLTDLGADYLCIPQEK